MLMSYLPSIHSSRAHQCPHSPHVEDEARLITHPIRRPGRFPYQIDIHDTDAGNAGNRILHHRRDRKGTRLNSSHRCISYAVFCLNKITETGDTYSSVPTM